MGFAFAWGITPWDDSPETFAMNEKKEAVTTAAFLNYFAVLNVAFITFHADATNQLAELAEAIRNADFIFRPVLNPHKPLSSFSEVDLDVIVIKMEIPELA